MRSSQPCHLAGLVKVAVGSILEFVVDILTAVYMHPLKSHCGMLPTVGIPRDLEQLAVEIESRWPAAELDLGLATGLPRGHGTSGSLTS